MSAIVDIIIPNYNYSTFLPRCLASLAAQPEVPLHVIILDDGSTSDSHDDLTILRAKHLSIEHKRHKFNRGHIYTYNQGISLVRASYYMVLSPDDCIIPGRLIRLLEGLIRHPSASLAFAPAYTGKDVNSVTGMLGIHGFEHLPRDKESLLTGGQFREILSSLWFNPVPTPSALVRTEAQRHVGGYRYTHPSAGDLEMWLRLSYVGPVVYVPEPVAFYRTHTGSMQHSYKASEYREWIHMVRVYAGMGLTKGMRSLGRELAWTTNFHRRTDLRPAINWLLALAAQPNWVRCLRQMQHFIARRMASLLGHITN